MHIIKKQVSQPWINQQLESIQERDRGNIEKTTKNFGHGHKKGRSIKKAGHIALFFLFIWKMYAHVLHRWKFTNLCRHSMYVYTGNKDDDAVCAKKNNDNVLLHKKIQHDSKFEIIFQAGSKHLLCLSSKNEKHKK